VRQGKYFELTLDEACRATRRSRVERIAAVLTNPVIEIRFSLAE
jgi:phosphoribosylformylglycinamidine (FGAM) synthase PurS component